MMDRRLLWSDQNVRRGFLQLTAATAEIYGDTLVFESGYKNLGYWNSQNDRAVWTVELDRDAAFDVWLDFACHNATAGNKFVLESGGESLVAAAPGTGTWEDYRQKQFGTIKLKAGRQRISFRAGPGLKNFLIDLREVRLVPVGSSDSAFASAPSR